MAIKVEGSEISADAGYGRNGYGGASSDTLGQRTRAVLTVNRDGVDPVLETIKQRGARKDDGTPATAHPTTYGHHKPNGSPSGKVGDVNYNQPSAMDIAKRHGMTDK